MYAFGQMAEMPQTQTIEVAKKALDNTKFLDFEKSKVQVLTLDQLKQTHRENDIEGKPMTGMYHFELLDALMEEADKRNFNLEIYDLFAAHNRDKAKPGVSVLPQIEEQYGPQAIQAHILRRIYANIRITNFDDPTYTTNLAVSFHQKGVQMALGSNIKICHNQMMLGDKEFYTATYSDIKGRKDLPVIQNLPEIAGTWFDQIEDTVIKERQRVENMKNYILKPEQLFIMLGMLHCIRVQHDTMNKDIRNANYIYPLGQTQLNDFTEDLMLRQRAQGHISLFDVYDAATDLYKGNRMDIPNILPQNKAMVNFLVDNYSI